MCYDDKTLVKLSEEKLEPRRPVNTFRKGPLERTRVRVRRPNRNKTPTRAKQLRHGFDEPVLRRHAQ